MRGGGGLTYMVYFPWVLKTVHCPVPGCLTIAHRVGMLWENFMYRYFHSRVAVFQEGKDSLPAVSIAAYIFQREGCPNIS